MSQFNEDINKKFHGMTKMIYCEQIHGPLLLIFIVRDKVRQSQKPFWLKNHLNSSTNMKEKQVKLLHCKCLYLLFVYWITRNCKTQYSCAS